MPDLEFIPIEYALDKNHTVRIRKSMPNNQNQTWYIHRGTGDGTRLDYWRDGAWHYTTPQRYVDAETALYDYACRTREAEYADGVRKLVNPDSTVKPIDPTGTSGVVGTATDDGERLCLLTWMPANKCVCSIHKKD